MKTIINIDVYTVPDSTHIFTKENPDINNLSLIVLMKSVNHLWVIGR